jgi:proline iminopeptidase
MEAKIDGVSIFYLSVGPKTGYPLIVLHGGPGLDHTMFRPWFDRLGDTFLVIYVDLRGQGRSERVDPSTLTLSLYARDVSALAKILGLERYAVLGHSYGAFVTLAHAVEERDASHYVISHGVASGAKMMEEVRENLARFEPAELRDQVTRSWDLEPQARTTDDVERLLEMQLPFHFAHPTGPAYREFVDNLGRAVFAPEVLAYAASHEYPIEYEDRLALINRPTLVISADSDRTCTVRSARDLHHGIAGSELGIIAGAGHMSYVEAPDFYFPMVRDFLMRHAFVAPPLP